MPCPNTSFPGCKKKMYNGITIIETENVCTRITLLQCDDTRISRIAAYAGVQSYEKTQTMVSIYSGKYVIYDYQGITWVMFQFANFPVNTPALWKNIVSCDSHCTPKISLKTKLKLNLIHIREGAIAVHIVHILQSFFEAEICTSLYQAYLGPSILILGHDRYLWFSGTLLKAGVHNEYLLRSLAVWTGYWLDAAGHHYVISRTSVLHHLCARCLITWWRGLLVCYSIL